MLQRQAKAEAIEHVALIFLQSGIVGLYHKYALPTVNHNNTEVKDNLIHSKKGSERLPSNPLLFLSPLPLACIAWQIILGSTGHFCPCAP